MIEEQWVAGGRVEEPTTHEITLLLQAWTAGDKEALVKLTPLVHRELHRAAQRYMAREGPGHMLQTTGLVNEVYVRLVDCGQVNWQDRSHFFAVSAQLMRRILVDMARAKASRKRDPGEALMSLDEIPTIGKTDPNLVALDDALETLARFDDRKVKVVELKFFGGLTVEETADVLKVSTRTVKRDWQLAKA